MILLSKLQKVKMPLQVINVIYYSIIILLLLRLLGSFIDPDLWWHIRLGQNILENNWINNLTFTCTDYVWVNHAWLSDVLISQLHKLGGFQGMSIFFSAVFGVGILFNFMAIKEVLKGLNTKLSRTLVLLYLTLFIHILTSFIAVRPQAFSFLFINVLLFVLIKISAANKVKYFHLLYLAPLFLLWVNLHGGFPIGIGLIGIFLIYHGLQLVQATIFNTGKSDVLKHLKYIFFLTAVLIVFGLVSLINPFGIKLWEEIFTLVLGSSNANFISEWKAINIKDYFMLFYFILCTAALVLQVLRRNYNLLRLLLLIIFGFLSFYSVRYILPASGIVIMVFIIELTLFINNFKYLFTDKESKRALAALKVLFWIVFAVFGLLWAATSLKFWDGLRDITNKENNTGLVMYPIKAAEFIKAHPETFSDLNFYNTYVWGGYLTYTLPGYNWFINGIMPEWHCNGKVKDTVMLDYVELESLNPAWANVLDRYNIQAVLIQNTSSLANVLKENDKWELLYQDELAVLYFKIRDL